ncbi:MAG: hypothetical protein WC855_11340 [Thermodesulfovibrionales bacterium]
MKTKIRTNVFLKIIIVLAIIVGASFFGTVLMEIFPKAGLIFFSMISCGVLLFLVIEVYYKTRKQNQISSPLIHLTTILLGIFLGILGLIIFLLYIVKFSHDAEAAIAPFFLAPFVLIGCVMAGIIIGLFYRTRDYRLIFSS